MTEATHILLSRSQSKSKSPTRTFPGQESSAAHICEDPDVIEAITREAEPEWWDATRDETPNWHSAPTSGSNNIPLGRRPIQHPGYPPDQTRYPASRYHDGPLRLEAAVPAPAPAQYIDQLVRRQQNNFRRSTPRSFPGPKSRDRNGKQNAVTPPALYPIYDDGWTDISQVEPSRSTRIPWKDREQTQRWTNDCNEDWGQSSRDPAEIDTSEW